MKPCTHDYAEPVHVSPFLTDITLGVYLLALAMGEVHES